MRKLRRTAALLAIATVVGAGALAGCSDSDSSEASTPADATTVVNTAVQTDQNGSTVATETAPPATDTGGTDTGTGEEPVGDVAAGKTYFEGLCQGCHADGGQTAGVGPVLAGKALTEDAVRNIIMNGRGNMPAQTQVTGADQDNVVAYVLSIQ